MTTVDGKKMNLTLISDVQNHFYGLDTIGMYKSDRRY